LDSCFAALRRVAIEATDGNCLKGVFPDRPACPAGLKAGQAGLPIGKNILQKLKKVKG
jgi:hypothetical protein